ncbi:hypothetical protein STRDD11_01358 [Streptococcus sp. DD11]|nr:hypothetical protein STRDD11_01358 [Streptococcus sp. DD11]
MLGIEAITLLFQGILLAAPLLLPIAQLIGGRHLPQTQTVAQKIRIQSRLLINPPTVAVHQLCQFQNIRKVVVQPFLLLALQSVQLHSLISQIEPVEVYPIFLFLLEFLTVFKESPNRENHTGPRHGHGRKDIDPPWLQQGNQNRHPDHEQRRHNQPQQLIAGLGWLLARGVDPNLVLRSLIHQPRRLVIIRIILVKAVARRPSQSQTAISRDGTIEPDFIWINLDSDSIEAQLITKA